MASNTTVRCSPSGLSAADTTPFVSITNRSGISPFLDLRATLMIRSTCVVLSLLVRFRMDSFPMTQRTSGSGTARCR